MIIHFQSPASCIVIFDKDTVLDKIERLGFENKTVAVLFWCMLKVAKKSFKVEGPQLMTSQGAGSRDAGGLPPMAFAKRR